MNLQTLDQLLAHQATIRPDKLAMTFQPSGGPMESRTYAQLCARAGSVAAALGPVVLGRPVVLAMPSGLPLVEGLFGIWHAGGIAVPVMPPRLGRRADRFFSILRDARPGLVLTDRASVEVIRPLCAETENPPAVLLLEELDAAANETQSTGLSADSVAMIQYTSGSIGTPKGVMLTHGNVLANQRQIAMNFGHTPDSVVVGWLPMHHDMGLVGNVVQPLFVGATVHIIPAESFLMRPMKWLELVTRVRATTSGAPNFGYDLAVSRISAEQVETLDLSSIRVSYNAAEPVRAHTIARFLRHFAPAGFRPDAMHPCYGLAEAALIVTGKAPGAALRMIRRPDEAAPRVSCGGPVIETEILIVDPESRTPMEAGKTGEIWVRGPSVAVGYWGLANDPAFGAETSDGQSGWLRTGDLGIMMDGELVVTGRLKDIVIVGGQNHAAEDIEHAVLRALDLGSDCGCAAFAIDGPQGEALVVAIELPRDQATEAAQLDSTVGMALTQAFDLKASHVVTVPRGRLPRTTSGKIRRGETRRLFLARTNPFDQP